MSLTTLENQLEQLENELRACFENAEGFDRQKAIEAEIRDTKDKIFHERIADSRRAENELELQIEAETEIAAGLEAQLTELAAEIDEKADELYVLRENHAKLSALRYVAEVNTRNARSSIRDSAKFRAIAVSERLANEKNRG